MVSYVQSAVLYSMKRSSACVKQDWKTLFQYFLPIEMSVGGS